MLSGQNKAESLQSLHDNIEKFIVYKYPDKDEWLRFKKEFGKFNLLSLEEKLTRLVHFLKEKSFERDKWISLFIVLIEKADSYNQLVTILSKGLDGIRNNKDEYRLERGKQFGDSLISKIIELKLDITSASALLTFSTGKTSVFNIVMGSFSNYTKDSNNEGLWDLINLLVKYVRNDAAIALPIYTLLKTTSEKGEGIGSLAVTQFHTSKLYFSLIECLEASHSKEQMYDLLDPLLVKAMLASLKTGKAKDRNRVAIRYFNEILTSDRKFDYFQKYYNDLKKLFINVTDDRGWLKEIALNVLNCLNQLLIDGSVDNAKKLVDIILAGKDKEDSLAFVFIKWLPDCKESQKELCTAFFEMIKILLERGIQAQRILDTFVPFINTKQGQVKIYYYLNSLILQNTVSMPLALSIVRQLLRSGLEESVLFDKVIGGLKGCLLENVGADCQRFSIFLVELCKNHYPVEDIESFIRKRSLTHRYHYSYYSSRSGRTISAHTDSYFTYCDYIFEYCKNQAGMILYPLVCAGLLPKKEFTPALCDAIIKYILTLPRDEKETALKNIRNQVTPLSDLFWEKHDVLFIHRQATLPLKYKEQIDEELSVLASSAASSLGFFSKEPKPTPRELSTTQFDAQFPVVPSNKDEKDDKSEEKSGEKKMTAM